MFRGKWEMRFAHRGDPKCNVAPRKEADLIMFVSGGHRCTCQIRRIHANAWSRPSEALAALGWKHIVPHAHSLESALTALWMSLDVQDEFDTAKAWDSNFGDDHEGEIIVWELRRIEGRYQNTDFTFDKYISTNMKAHTLAHTHICMQVCRRATKARARAAVLAAAPAAAPAAAAVPASAAAAATSAATTTKARRRRIRRARAHWSVAGGRRICSSASKNAAALSATQSIQHGKHPVCCLPFRV